MSGEENLVDIGTYGMKNVCGYDIKQDLNAARFKTGAFTYVDSSRRGRVGAVTICNQENRSSCIKSADNSSQYEM